LGVITVIISDELERRVREYLRRTGRTRRGSLSRLVEDALRTYLELAECRERVFYAEVGGRVVARASSLRELAERLKEAGIDARSARILCTEALREGRRFGLRGERA